MSDEDIVTGHGIYLSGNFEIEEKTSQEMQREAEYRTYVLSIPCSGANRDRCFSYEIRATGFSSKAFKLIPKNTYYLRGAFFPRNSLDTRGDQLFFEASDRGLISSGEGFDHSLVDTVGITSLGRVSKTYTIIEDTIQHLIPKNPHKDKLTTIVTVQHSDYHPDKKENQRSKIEYRIRPFPHLAGSHKIVKNGRECQFHGYIKDFNEETGCYIAIVSRVSPTSGHVDASDMIDASRSTAKHELNSSQGNRNKPVKFNPRSVTSPFVSPLITSDSRSSIPFGPSDFGETSFSSASSRSQEQQAANKDVDSPALEDDAPPPKKKKSKAASSASKSTAPPATKRPRAPRARRNGAGGKVLDIASDD